MSYTEEEARNMFCIKELKEEIEDIRNGKEKGNYNQENCIASSCKDWNSKGYCSLFGD
jgi:hypothetical protein